MADRVARRWLISGRVQGVGYRAWMQARALEAGLEGWVRNLEDGRVEALVCGAAASLAGLRRTCLSGPGPARVDGIEDHAAEPVPQGSGFGTRPG
ncbi:acylphosphatase [Lichenicoccus sp.]|uniref:acylphosphatase n=1 Tax=Lichenicoccus sp. TaxID=2781899 RepID=UPI003D1531F5